MVLVAGDVNSTLACAIVASKLHIKIAHIESGLRSFDKKMPEEINRIITDNISDLLFTTEPSGNENLLREGMETSRVHLVGNTMIDSLLKCLPKAEKMAPWKKYGFSGGDYFLLTLHRPSNVDNKNNLKTLVYQLSKICSLYPIILLFTLEQKKISKNIILAYLNL